MSEEKRNKLLLDNIGVIYSFCNRNTKYLYLFDDMHDFISACTTYVLENLDKYDETKGSISTFINSILRNYVCYYLARQFSTRYNIPEKVINKNKSILGVDINKLDFYEEHPVYELIEKNEIIDIVNTHISELLYDYFFNEMSIPELVEKNKMSRAWVYLKINSDLDYLKMKLREKGYKNISIKKLFI